MKANILFLASIRDALGVRSLTVELEEGERVSGLIRNLTRGKGQEWLDLLTAENTRIAVNQAVVNGDPVLRDGDEIAFLPPVTGG